MTNAHEKEQAEIICLHARKLRNSSKAKLSILYSGNDI